MKKICLFSVFISLLLLEPSWLAGAPSRLSWRKSAHYKVGEQIDPAVFVHDRRMGKVRLLDLIDSETRVAVLVLFGGGIKELPPGRKKRGPLWCEDSFDDLPIQRALLGAFKVRAVQFIPIAVPPVYHAANYGWDEDDFLGFPDDSEQYLAAARTFIQATEEAVKSTLLPFHEIYYDPKFRLAENSDERKLDSGYGTVYEWQGKLRWGTDARRYGTPVFWFLNSSGRVLTEPLLGNNYDADPPEINYGFREVSDLLEELLGETGSGF